MPVRRDENVLDWSRGKNKSTKMGLNLADFANILKKFRSRVLVLGTRHCGMGIARADVYGTPVTLIQSDHVSPSYAGRKVAARLLPLRMCHLLTKVHRDRNEARQSRRRSHIFVHPFPTQRA
jgi:hypothetical protein